MTSGEGYLDGVTETAVDGDWETTATSAVPAGAAVQAVWADMWDEEAWNDTPAHNQAVREVIEAAATEEFPEVNADHLYRDVFQLFNQHDPSLTGPGMMSPDHAKNHSLVEVLEGFPEMQRLRQFTRDDPFASTAALLSVSEEIQKLIVAVEEDTDEEAAQGGVREALQDAADDAESFQEMVQVCGTDPGELQRMTFKERQELAKRLTTSQMRKFADMVGKFKATARAESRKRIPGESEETANVVAGDDLVRLHSSEFPNLASPELEALFWSRWTERNLMIADRRAVEKKAKGPVVVVCDESGSMAGEDEIWAKAFSLALADQARRSKRPFVYLGFASQHEHRVIDLTKPSLDAAIDMVEGFLGGGTDIFSALKAGLEQVKILAALKQGDADLVLITDGVDDTMNGGSKQLETIVSFAKETSTTIFGVFVDTSNSGIGREATAKMGNYCTTVRSISDVAETSSMADIYTSIK